MSKRLSSSPANHRGPGAGARSWAKYLTAMTLGLAVGWSSPGSAQEAEVMNGLEVVLAPVTADSEAEAAPDPADKESAQPLPVNPAPPDSAGPAPGRPVRAGSLIVVPPPPWYGAEKWSTSSQPILLDLQPEFRAGRGTWRELNIGQAESPPSLAGEPVATNQPDPATGTDNFAEQPEPPPKRGRQQLKNLFGDLFVSDTDRSEPNAAAGPAPEASVQSLVQNKVQEPGPVELAGQARIIASGRPGVTVGQRDVKPQDSSPAAASPGQNLRILPVQGSSASDSPMVPAKASPTIVRKGKGGPAVTPKGSLSPPSRRERTKPYLILINETGRPETGREYQRVLEAMGYQVISLHERTPQKGATFISYRPGQKARAQELAQRLPGRRLSLEARSGECLPTEITIYIR